MQFNDGALRPGQREALSVIEQRVLRENVTAIVLPCRYGKSDLARLAALKLWDEGVIAGAVALSPNTILRGQIAETAKWDAALLRYGVTLRQPPKIAQVDRMKLPLAPNGEMFLSITTQLAVSQKEALAAWIEHRVHATKRPVVVFVDECHTGSEENTWGEVVPALTDAGAHVVLLTATAERADGKRIPGFRFETLEAVEDVKVYRCSPGSTPEMVRVDVLMGARARLRLVPDCEVTFAEAWAIGALCKVARNPFDVDLRTVKGLDEEHQWLSEMSPTRSRELLGRLVRQPVVVQEGCRRLVESLRSRRRVQIKAQGIVFCGNDTDGDRSNAHPKEIERAIRKLDPTLVVLVATSTDGDGDAIVQKFIDGHGDVLIVKQMAGIGLDVGELKIGLDLSPTRTYASFVQRMMRPATPHNGVMAMEWISPDDVVSAAHFEKLVTSQGGEATVMDLTRVDTYEKERQSKPDVELALFPDKVSPGDFDDSGNNRAGREQWAAAQRLADTFPVLLNFHSHAEIAALAEASGIGFAAEDKPLVGAQNTGNEAVAVRADLVRMAKDITTWRVKRWRGGDYSKYPREIEEVWIEAKTEARWPRGAKLDESDDLAALGRMRRVLESMTTDIAEAS